MKKHFRKPILILPVALVVFGLSGCGEKSSIMKDPSLDKLQKTEREEAGARVQDKNKEGVIVTDVHKKNNDEKDGGTRGDEVDYFIPELGINIKVSPELKNELIYEYRSKIKLPMGGEGHVAFFSTKEINKINGKCIGSLGSIVKVDGDNGDYEKDFSSMPGFKEFNDFFIFYQGPQAPCTVGSNGDRNDFYSVEKPLLDEFYNLITQSKERRE